MKKTRLCELLGIEYPVIQAPMDWITDAGLAAAVSNAGGLGVIGPNAGERTVTDNVVETGERLRREIRKAKSLTDKPFGVNLIVVELPIGFPEGGKAFSDQCLKVTLEEGVPVAVLVGNTPEAYAKQLKKAGIKVLHRALPAVNVAAARKAEEAGVDAFVAVGFEGGGHTGADCISTSVLVPQIVDALRIPVVAGGGIADGRGMIAALSWGAEGVYMGTRFIAPRECPAHEKVKQAIVKADDVSTLALRGILGMVRSLKTPLTTRCGEMEAAGYSLREITDLYHSGYIKGMLEGNAIEGTFICGSACGLIREIKGAATVVQDTIREADQILASL
jgi:NAD(P)H-dependent flavin oxidoreductase YrpB (nitropropane dioxygenase family)